MAKPLFSVIIPTLNEELFLPELLKDFTKQQVKNFEILIVDGKSNDKTQHVAQRFEKEVVLRFITTPKRQVSHQRNLGARKARGKYLVFLDADARVYPTFTKRLELAVLLRKHKLMLPTTVPDNEYIRHKVGFKLINMLVEISHRVGKPFSTASYIFIHKEVFKDLGGFDEKVFVAEDHKLIQKAFKNGIKPRLLKDTKVVVSLRRFKKEGNIKVLYKYVFSTIYMIINGDIRKKIYAYEMGGQGYK